MKPSERIFELIEIAATARLQEMKKESHYDFLSRISGSTDASALDALKHDPKIHITAIVMFLDEQSRRAS